jgi:hypothetical protein
MVDLTVYITNSTSVAISEPIDIDLYFNPATPPDGSFAGTWPIRYWAVWERKQPPAIPLAG